VAHLFSWLILGSLFVALTLPLPSNPQQGEVTFSNFQEQINFGSQITFQVKVTTQDTINQVFLFLEIDQVNILPVTATINKRGEITGSYDANQGFLQPFDRIEYYYKVILKDGRTLESPHHQFEYRDTRFDWQQLSDNHFEVFWYSGGLQFGQELLGVSQDSLASIRRITNRTPSSPVRIYVYETAADLQKALQLTHNTWIAGHANPAGNLILVSISPGTEQRVEMERQLPHELMHIVQFQMAGEESSRLPTWLVEGMASIVELYPNPDYQYVLDNAVQSRSLLSLSSLCSSFPRDAAGAFLAYAESASFMRYIFQNYGQIGISKLIAQYKNGLGCEEGSSAALGQPLSKLETSWQQESLGINTGALVFEKLLPYLFLLALIALPPAVVVFFLLKK